MNTNTAAPSSSFYSRWQRRAVLIALTVTVIGLVLVALILPIGYLTYRHSEPKVTASSAAGRVLNVQLFGGLFSRGFVETDVGFYALEEGISLKKGELLTLQERDDKARYLCDADSRCTRLLRRLQ